MRGWWEDGWASRITLRQGLFLNVKKGGGRVAGQVGLHYARVLF